MSFRHTSSHSSSSSSPVVERATARRSSEIPRPSRINDWAIGGTSRIMCHKEIVFSSYVLRGFDWGRMQLTISDSDYIMVVGYRTDCQPPGITGKGSMDPVTGQKETPTLAAWREMSEETGLAPISEEYLMDYGNGFYTIDARDVVAARGIPHKLPKDDHRNRVCVLIHGSYDEMIELLRVALEAHKGDGITDVYIVHKYHANNIFRHAQRNHDSRQLFTYNFDDARGYNHYPPPRNYNRY